MVDCRTGNRISDCVAEINITGNVIPSVWFKTIVNDKGRPYLLAIMILSEIVYWYRPVEERDENTGEFIGYRTKFKQDILQKSYQDLANYYQVTKRQVTDAIIALEKLGVIKREFRTVEKNNIRCNNVLFIRLNPDKLRDLTYPHDMGNDECESEQNTVGSSSRESKEPIETEDISENKNVDNVENVDKNIPLSRNFGIGSHEKMGQPLTKFRKTNTENTNRRLLYNPISSNHLARDECIDLFAEQISYDEIRCDYLDNQCALDVLDQCVEIAGNVMSSEKSTFRIGGETLSTKYVINKLSKMNIMHMKYVIDCFLKIETEIRKIQSYLLACMVNSIASIGVKTANDLARNGFLVKRGSYS